jgi:hypothetical protein
MRTRGGVHATKASAFVEELAGLAARTGDARFRATLEALRELNLIDSAGRWKRKRDAYEDDLDGVEPEIVAAHIQLSLARGASLRVACAYFVSDCMLYGGASFDASVKKIARLYRAHVGQASDSKVP